MALDATVGGPAANSYLTLAAADLLNQDRLGDSAAAWDDASDGTKTKALIQATADIDAYVTPARAWDADQLLLFPRSTDVVDAVPYIPNRIAHATFEQALYLVVNVELLEDAASRRARGMFSFNENDGLSGTIAIDGKLGLIAPRAEQLLSGFTSTSGSRRIGSLRLRSSMSWAAEQAALAAE